MARRQTRVILNRQKVHEVRLAMADGLFEVARTVIEVAADNAPDSPYDPYPTGEGLPKQGGALAYVDNQKVAGWHIRGIQPRKPRVARGGRGIEVYGGFGFPARFAELGTVRTPARPFLTPALNQTTPHAARIIEPIVARHLRRIG